MRAFLTSAALAALLAGAPALAADNSTPAAGAEPAAAAPANPDDQQLLKDKNAANDTAAPATNTTDTAATPAPADTTNTAQTPAVTQPAAEPAPAVAAGGAPNFINQQAAEEQLASNWIGQTVYSKADENLGDVNDLVLSKDGKIDAIVIGVGGFLGIGEKNVALPFSAFQASTDSNGKLKLVVDTTKEALDAAPTFMTLAEIQSQNAVANPPAAEPATPGAPAPAPAQ